MAPKTERVELRLESEIVQRLDTWREDRGISTRSGAIRELIDQGLEEHTTEGFRLNKTDRLTMWMLAEVLRNQINARPEKEKNKEHDMETMDVIQEAIYGGHYWALSWQLPGIMHDHVDDPKRVRAVMDILDTWDCIESAFESYSEAERNEVDSTVDLRGNSPRFFGFDGNNETEYLGIASFLIHELKRFSRFKDRELNSHMPTVARYRDMARIFENIRPSLVGRKLSVSEITEILRRD